MSIGKKTNLAEQVCWMKYIFSQEECSYCSGRDFLCENYTIYLIVDPKTFFAKKENGIKRELSYLDEFQEIETNIFN